MTESRAERKFRRQVDVAAQHFQAGDTESARRVLEALLKKSPTVFKPEVHQHLASIAGETGDAPKALDHLNAAAKLQPNNPETWLKIGVLNMEQEAFAAAADAYRRLTRLAPGNPEALVYLADALQNGAEAEASIDIYREALALAPDHAAAWTNLAMACLREGRWDEALDAVDRQLELMPGHTGALSLKCIALPELGRDAELRALVDFDRLIGRFDISPDPAAYPDLQTFNRALAGYCKAHPSLAYEPKANTTMGGWQTGDMAPDGAPAIAELLRQVEACVHRYVDERPLQPGHPFLGQRPKGWNYYLWGTVLKSEGHQASHIHRDGWLSGVYYADLPEGVGENRQGDSADGWIEFGEPQAYPKSKAESETRTYEPVEGRLYLFPSYFYHRTVPFNAARPRVSLAFDLQPTP